MLAPPPPPITHTHTRQTSLSLFANQQNAQGTVAVVGASNAPKPRVCWRETTDEAAASIPAGAAGGVTAAGETCATATVAAAAARTAAVTTDDTPLVLRAVLRGHASEQWLVASHMCFLGVRAFAQARIVVANST